MYIEQQVKLSFPNLYIVGAPKCGTSTLHEILKTHPDIFMSEKKEPRFWCDFKTSQFFGPGSDIFTSSIIGNVDEYLREFSGREGRLYAGESSTDYFQSRVALNGIKKQCPASKIVIMLRDPVERMYSEYMHTVRDGLESESFMDSLVHERKRRQDGWQPLFSHQKRSAYALWLGRWIAAFGADNVCIIVYEEFCRDPRSQVRRVYEFLGIEDNNHTQIEAIRENASNYVFSKKVGAMMYKLRRRKKKIEMIFGRKIVSAVNRCIKLANKKEKPNLSDAEYFSLRRKFRRENIYIEKKYGIRVDAWTRAVSVSIVEPVGCHGGMDYYTCGMLGGLLENGADALLCTSGVSNNLLTEKNSKAVFNHFNNMWDGNNQILKFIRYIKGILLTVAMARRRSIRIVHLHTFQNNFVELLLFLVCKIFFKVVITMHDIEGFRGKGRFGFTLASRSDGIIVHNNYMKRRLLSLFGSAVANTPLAVIPHGNYMLSGRSVLLRGSGYQEDSNERGAFKVLFFGQIKKVKGLDILIRALSELPEMSRASVSVKVCGKCWGDDLSIYKKMVDDLNLNDIIYFDNRYIPDEEVDSIFSWADLVVLPYREIYQSGVVIHAMSYGRVVLTSDLEAMKEMVFDGVNGYLFASENSFDLARKIEYIMSLPFSALSEVGGRGAEYVRLNNDWVSIGKKIINFYEDVLVI